jgi:hypothetical protein
MLLRGLCRNLSLPSDKAEEFRFCGSDTFNWFFSLMPKTNAIGPKTCEYTAVLHGVQLSHITKAHIKLLDALLFAPSLLLCRPC